MAINKIDSPKANIQRTENMLLEAGLQIEKLGGDIQAVPISALKKQNLNQLTEALVLQADMMDIGGDPTGPVEAVIVESNMHPYRGKVSTIVVQRGTLKKGDILVAGTAMAKVRTLKNADGVELSEVPPGYPAEIDGWRALPNAGEIVLQAESEKYAKQVIKVCLCQTVEYLFDAIYSRVVPVPRGKVGGKENGGRLQGDRAEAPTARQTV